MRQQKLINKIKKKGNSYYLNVPKGIVLLDGWENINIKLVEWNDRKLVFEKFDLFAPKSKEEKKDDKN